MVNSRFEYVREFEREERLLPDTFIIAEVQGSGFKPFCSRLPIARPYDDRLIRLFAAAARETMDNFADIELAYGFSDSHYFIFKRSSTVFNRRRDKILSNVISLFVAAFVFQWPRFFEFPLSEPPDFVGRIIVIPRRRILKDFLIAKQRDSAMDCIREYTAHVLLRAGRSPAEAGDLSFNDQNELLFTHGINFNSLPAWHKRGKILIREKRIIETSDDVSSVKPDFWKKHPKLFQ
jgi:tRNA(His) guanylyltransferase